MKLIDTSGITTGTQYPGLANVGGQSVGNPPFTASGDTTKFQGLDFLQQNVLDMVNAICMGMVIDTTVATWICVHTTFGGGEASISGYVYYGGEVFYVPSQVTSPVEEGHYFIANIDPNPTDNGTSAPKTTMSDTSTVSIHNQRTITLSQVTSGTGNFPNLGDWAYSQNNFQWAFPLINVVGGSGQPVYATGWSVWTRLIFYILGNEVTIQGDARFAASAAGLIFTLPENYWPLYDLNFVVYCPSGISIVNIAASTGQVTFEGSTTTGDQAVFIYCKYTIL
jgi:hypothetical protein